MENINWELVGYALITLLTASGVTFGWLKKMCKKIESTNLAVEEHKDEIKVVLANLQSVIAEMKELQRKE